MKFSATYRWVWRDQVGQLGNSLPFAPGNAIKRFFIIEPTCENPDLYSGYAKRDQEAMSTLMRKTNFNEK